jgi:hypothetical protein
MKNQIKIMGEEKKEHVCSCGCIIRSDGISQHLKTQKHINLINNQNIIKISS